MKEKKKILAFLCTMVLCIGMMTMTVSAVSTEQDGLEVSLTADKNEYSQGDQITATLAVTNTNGVTVSNVSLSNIIPEGYILAEGSEAEKQIETLDAGETVTISAIYIADMSDKGDNTGDTGKPSDENANNDDPDKGTTGKGNSQSTGSKVQTGDNANVVLWIAIAVIAGAVIIVALIVKKKKGGKGLLSFFLCFVLTGTIFSSTSVRINAEEIRAKTITVVHNIIIDNRNIELKAFVTYDAVQSEEPVKDTYVVTFETNGGTEVEAQSVEFGQTVSQPENPEREGYVFYGWYKDQLLSEPYDFSTPVESNITLYAKWVSEDDNLNDEIIDLGDIQSMISDGTIEVIFNDNGDISSIDGPVSDNKINSSSDAVELLNSMSSLFDTDFEVNESNISTRVTDDGEEKFYCYSPINNEISVLGSQIIIATDNIGNITGVYSTYKSLVNNIDINPTINADEAEAVAKEALLSDNKISNFIESYVSEDISSEELNDIFINLQTIDNNLIVYAASNSDTPILTYEVRISTNMNLSNTDETVLSEEENTTAQTGETNNSETVQTENDTSSETNELNNVGEIESNENTVTQTNEITNDEETQAEETSESETENSNSEEEAYELPPLVSKTFYVHANGDNAGDIYLAIDNNEDWSTVYVTSEDLNDVEREYVAQQEGDKYRLVDSIRNITTYESDDYIALDGPWYSTDSYYLASSLPGTIVESNWLFGTRMPKDAVSAHSNMEAVYDYYKNTLNRNSFDGAGAKIKISIHYKALVKNAYWSSDYQQMLYGSVGNFEAGLDVAGHEFTHAVINYVVGNGADRTLTYSNESGALNEAYADILGELIENKNGSDNWLLGEDTSNAIRSMADPSIYNQPEHYDNRYVGTSDNGGVHTNSGIFNFAAYKMMTDSRTNDVSNSTWAKIFYRSLYRLATDATFLDARGAVISSAKALGLNGTQQQAIKDAFDAVGIKETDSIRIVLTWGESPSDLDSHLVGPSVDGNGRFHVYYGSRNYYNNGAVSSDDSSYAVDLDYDDTTSYGPEITTIHTLTPGEYYFYVHDYSNGSSSTSTAMANSGATVKVYKGSSNTVSHEYHVSTSSNGTYWNVFKLTISSSGDSSFEELNTYGSSATYD